MKRLTNGFSLLEVLITILLTAIGILGMVAMQGQAIRHTQDSVQRTHAVMLANDLMEIIRARPSVLADLQAGVQNADSPLFSALASTAPNDCVQLGANNLMSNQVGCWAQKVRRYLPGAGNAANSFHACFSTTPGACDNAGAIVEIQIAWEGIGGECMSGNETVCIYRFRSQI
ncbi:type IV pilus assembly protein PilV [Halopseudomonas xinjiangensis]|uniref:Type IV pilus assembly protein PilV n=1 Tax=Halopseudomonas xinjiangensis TaxID=487184 RepID=A0A1H1LRA7_9GAMM|nr:type IV pilus modification protein PilV [Halopseudomonas xinjiangensis]SDR77154.1 type IV pilus assembly protein PilV [Halopseudomonas xinjiangensis]